ncbi:adenylyl-sulfate kinase [Shewanella sp.]|uniref:adenylyl-sulfate kinase n=1 Tax=Shewanella sp. TaxID=50422 RepID=UPI004047D51B
MNDKKSGVIWITGYSSAGKSTIAAIVHQKLLGLNYCVIHLDGDELRSLLGNNFSHTFEDRRKLAIVYSNLAKKLSSSDLIVVISVVAMFKEIYNYNRKVIDNYFEVFLDVPFDVLKLRDQKAIYSDIKNTARVMSEYDIPRSSDLTIDNSGRFSAIHIADLIVSKFISCLRREKFMKIEENIGELNNDPPNNSANYWNDFYLKSSAPISSSSFAIFCDERFFQPDSKIIEFGCGNGRDSFYLGSRHRVTAIDPSQTVIDLNKFNNNHFGINFICSKFNNSLSGLVGSNYDVVYSRFVMHAMNESEEDEAISFARQLLKDNGLLCLEFRTDKDPLMESGAKLSSSERLTDHYRRFINFDLFVKKLQAVGFQIIFQIEKNDLAIYKDDNPVVGRIVANKIG